MTASNLFDFLRRELAPTPVRGSATFRLTLACLAATIPILTHRIPHGLIVMIVMYLITQEDTAATLIGSILGVVGVTIGLGLALLAWEISLDIVWLRLCFLVVFLFGGSIPQARSNDRRAGLRHRSASGPRDDPSGCVSAGPGAAGRVCALDLVVRDTRTLR